MLEDHKFCNIKKNREKLRKNMKNDFKNMMSHQEYQFKEMQINVNDILRQANNNYELI